MPFCDQRAEAVRLNPGLWRRTSKQCELVYKPLEGEATFQDIFQRHDEFFSMCPAWDRLPCPDDPNFSFFGCVRVRRSRNLLTAANGY